MVPQFYLKANLHPLARDVIGRGLVIIFLLALSSISHSKSIENQNLAECKSIEAGFETANLLPYLFHFVDDGAKIAPSYINTPYELNTVFEGINFQRSS